MSAIPPGGTAVVVGASGGIGAALADALEADGRFARVLRLSRGSAPPLDVTEEASVAAAFSTLAAGPALRLVVVASGFLHGDGHAPERGLASLDATHLARAFAINAIGPALVMKHALPLLPAEGKAVIAALSAKVGSIGDNRLGGWHAYRASKAALNQLVRTASVELARRRPHAACVAIHPGTTDTRLSAPFSKAGLAVRSPEETARRVLAVIEGVTPAESGLFLNHDGERLPW